MSDNYWITKAEWLSEPYNLKGNELALYSIIASFTKGDATFTGSLQTLEDWTGIKRPHVCRALSSLTKKGLLEKNYYTRDGVRRVEYKAVFLQIDVKNRCYQNGNEGVTKMATGVTKMVTRCYQNGNEGVTKMGTVPNNIIDNNIDNNIEGEADASDTQTAKVKLTLEGEEEKEKKVAPKKEKDIAEREQEFRLAASIYNATYGEQLVKEFCDYWTEPTTGGKKLRWEMQKTWDLKRRLATWYSNEQKFYGNRRGTAQQPQQKRPQDMTNEELRKARGEEAFKEYLKRQAEGVMI